MLSDSLALPRLTAPIVLGVILAAVGMSGAAPLVPLTRTSKAWTDDTPKDQPSLPKLNVGECLRIALEKQPKLTGLQASLASANASLFGQQKASLLCN